MTFPHGESHPLAAHKLEHSASPLSPPTAKTVSFIPIIKEENASYERLTDAHEYNTIHSSKVLLIVNATHPVSYVTARTALLQHCEDAIICGIHLAVTKFNADKLLIVSDSAMVSSRYALERLCEKYAVAYPGESAFISDSTDFRHLLATQESENSVVKMVTLEEVYDLCASQDEKLESVGRFVTVLGEEVNSPGNYLASVGKQIKTVLENAQINAHDDARILLVNSVGEKHVGKPTDIITEDLSGVVMLPAKDAVNSELEACHHCGACVGMCPMGLEPVKLSWLSRLNNAEHALQNGIMDCIECGACSFACAASRPLMDYIREGKRMCGLQRCV